MALQRLKRGIARVPFLTRLLFGVRAPSSVEQGHWDYSTLVLFSELKKKVRPGQRILELGTGSTATLSIAMARRVDATYLALDIDETAVSTAREVARANRVSVEFQKSDLFAALPLESSFDVTFFNPPYVPRALSVGWSSLGEPARVWDGGEDGLEIIRRFWIEAGMRRDRLGTILLGFNRKSVREAEIVAIAAAQSFTVVDTARAFHPGTVFTFSAIAPNATATP